MTLRLDRRQFGRRTTCLHAWVRAPGRPPIACLVRDLSVQGAFLTFPVPSWLPDTFLLRIDATRFAAECSIRHMRADGCGVVFADALPLLAYGYDTPEQDSVWPEFEISPSLRRDRH